MARPGVGVGVFVLSDAHPGCVLLGQRLGSHGEGTWALPGGHLERFEEFVDTAHRECAEETGQTLREARVGTVINVAEREIDYHYVVAFVVARTDDEPQVLEPNKCAEWRWVPWADRGAWPAPLFWSLEHCVREGFDPFASSSS